MPVDQDSLARLPERKSSAGQLRPSEVEPLLARIRHLERMLAAGAARSSDASAPSTRLDNVFFRQLFDNSPDGMVLLGVDDRVIDANRAFEEMFGYSLAEVQGRVLTQLIVPEGSAEEALDLTGAVVRGEVINSERRRRRKDGSTVEVRIVGYPIFDGERLMGLFGIYSDISFRKTAERRLRLQGAAMNAAASSILITDTEGKIEWVNPAFCRLSGYREDEVLGRSPDLLAADEDSRIFAWENLRSLEVGDLWRGHAVQRHKAGHLYTVDQTVTRLSDPADRRQHFVIVQQDITSRLEAEQRLRYLAGHDFLTDLPNRYNFNKRLKLEVERSIRNGRSLAMLLLDIDQFKDINDTFGHAVGDDFLIAVSERLAEVLQNGCTLARFGGDEFAVLQPDLSDTGGATELAQRLIHAFTRPVEVDDREVHLSVSIGIAIHRSESVDPRELVKNADLALYKAKNEGGSTFRLYLDGMDLHVRQRMRYGQQLHRAIERRELELEYQAQVDARSRRIVAIEGLLRWHHPEQGLVPPADFVPIAEASGLIVPIGNWVLRRACAEAQEWRVASGIDIPIAVNLSPVQFKDPDLHRAVGEALDSSGLPPSLLELELTEGLLMQASDSVEAMLRRLRERGVRFSLDDFGKGYSSLSYLIHFPLDKLKIDSSFVREVPSNEQSRVIVNAIATLGSKLGVEVVAEGVERPEQLHALLAEGCHRMQGFLFNRPMPGSSVLELLGSARGRLPEL